MGASLSPRKMGAAPAAARPANDDGVSWLYVIAANDDGPVKIGLSSSPTRRLAQFQTASAVALKIWHTEAVPAADVMRLEKSVHKQLNRSRLSGEWFAVSVSIAVAEVTLAIIHHADNPPPRGGRLARR